MSVTAPPSAGARTERIPLGLKIAFGAPTFASAALSIPIAIHLTKFYADVVLVPLGYLGLVIAISRAFDAMTDPVVGWLSDRTRTRFGRRRPFLAVGAPLCALAFIALCSPPEWLSGGQAIAWFGVSFALYYLFHTVYLVPHFALGPELTLDYHDRSSLYGVREAFLVVGTLSAAVLPGLLESRLEDERQALSVFAWIFGGLLVVLYAWLTLRVRERPEFSLRAPNPLVPGIRRVFANRPFLILLGTSLLTQIGGILSGALMPFFNQYVLRPENPSLWLSIFLATYFGSGFLFLPAWLVAARRFGKRPVWLASFAFPISGGALLFGLGEGDLLPAVVLLAWAGAGFGAASFLAFSVKADVIDYDELQTGRRREAQFTAMWLILPKFVSIPGAAIPVALLGSSGYVPNAVQTPEVQDLIRGLFALGTAATSALALLVAWRFPMNEAVHRAIQKGIEARARGERVVDPLSGRELPPFGGADLDAAGWYLDHFSPGELRRTLVHGPGRLVREVALAAALTGLGAVASAAFVVTEVGDPNQEPGALAVLAVVAAGLFMTLFAFHVLRIRAALRFAGKHLPEATLRLHLGLTGSGSPGALVGPTASAYHPADPARSTPASPREEA